MSIATAEGGSHPAPAQEAAVLTAQQAYEQAFNQPFPERQAAIPVAPERARQIGRLATLADNLEGAHDMVVGGHATDRVTGYFTTGQEGLARARTNVQERLDQARANFTDRRERAVAVARDVARVGRAATRLFAPLAVGAGMAAAERGRREVQAVPARLASRFDSARAATREGVGSVAQVREKIADRFVARSAKKLEKHGGKLQTRVATRDAYTASATAAANERRHVDNIKNTAGSFVQDRLARHSAKKVAKHFNRWTDRTDTANHRAGRTDRHMNAAHNRQVSSASRRVRAGLHPTARQVKRGTPAHVTRLHS